ncbi:MAG: GNAT family N-acetyltransferase [Caulobacteraceae bacterium]
MRRAGPADGARLGRLRGAFWKDQIAKGLLDIPSLSSEALESSTVAILKRARTSVFVCDAERSPVGYIFGQTRIVPAAGASVISSIEEIYVEPRLRGGASAALELMSRAMQDFEIAGAQRIQLRVLVNNADGRRFFERYGFVVNLLLYEYNPGQR